MISLLLLSSCSFFDGQVGSDDRAITKESFVVHPEWAPDELFLVARDSPSTASIMPFSAEARSAPLPGIRLNDFVLEGDMLVGTWGGHSRRLTILHHEPAVAVAPSVVAARRRLIEATGRLGKAPCSADSVLCAIRESDQMCEYTGDQVQILLDLGLELDDVVDGLVYELAIFERGLLHGLNPPLVLRTTHEHVDEIADRLWSVALEPSVDLNSRTNALASLWWLTRPEEEESLGDVALGDDLLRIYMAGLGSAPSDCKARFFESMPRRK